MLTVAEIQKLQPGDCLWVEEKDKIEGAYYYVKEKDKKGCSLVSIFVDKDPDLNLKDYGNKWIAYRNKEESSESFQSYEKKYQALCDSIRKVCHELNDRNALEYFYSLTFENKLQMFEE